MLVPWMWFGAIFIAGVAALGFTIAAYTCVRVRELAMPLGTLALLASAGAQLPGFIVLAGRLDGDAGAPLSAALGPMAAGWAGMWLASLLVAAGLHWKERLRAGLAAAGRTWTTDDATHRSVMRADLRETQRQIDAMSDAQLAKVTRKLMRVRLRGGGRRGWGWGGRCAPALPQKARAAADVRPCLCPPSAPRSTRSGRRRCCESARRCGGAPRRAAARWACCRTASRRCRRRRTRAAGGCRRCRRRCSWGGGAAAAARRRCAGAAWRWAHGASLLLAGRWGGQRPCVSSPTAAALPMLPCPLS
jgi:hypothetical protein